MIICEFSYMQLDTVQVQTHYVMEVCMVLHAMPIIIFSQYSQPIIILFFRVQ